MLEATVKEILGENIIVQGVQGEYYISVATGDDTELDRDLHKTPDVAVTGRDFSTILNGRSYWAEICQQKLQNVETKCSH